MRARILMIAGFGDNSSMYAPLLETPLAQNQELIPLDLPGFGAPALDGETTLQTLADHVKDAAIQREADTIVAHSVASIIASLAAGTKGSPLKRIISLEGNLTDEDAYFSGRAAEFEDAASFRDWFLPRLAKKAESDPILARYTREVAKADPQALWELGCDARRFSDKHHAGERLRDATAITYIVNPDNCAEASMTWLGNSGLATIKLPGASHWPTIDQPAALARAIERVLVSED